MPWWPCLSVETGETLLSGTLSRLPLGARFRRGPAAAAPPAPGEEPFLYGPGRFPFFGGDGWADELQPALRRHPNLEGSRFRGLAGCLAHQRMLRVAKAAPGDDGALSSRDTGSGSGSSRSPAAFGIAILGTLWGAACVRFLPFPRATISWATRTGPTCLRRRSRGHLSAWNHGLAMGHPTVLQRMNLMLFLPAIALKALVGDTETAARVYLVLAHTLSGWAFYALARLYVRRKAVAAFASLLYLVAPLHVAELTLYGHWALAQSFALSPLVLALVVLAVRERGRAGLRYGLALAPQPPGSPGRTTSGRPRFCPSSSLLRRTRFASRRPASGRRPREGSAALRSSRHSSPRASCCRA